jgi:2-amino-4-hydroxy-6-hydroxymethyldihydropteridine diphosphokinase
MTETVYILLGPNVGDREKHLLKALDRIEMLEGLEVVATSAMFVSEAQEMEGENPSFLNQVVKAEYQFKPLELLSELERIENELGRTDKGAYLPRTIDLDILLFGEQVIDRPQLVVPHARLESRPFALIPLLDIDPGLTHPVGGQPLADLVTDRDREKVVLYREHVARNI